MLVQNRGKETKKRLMVLTVDSNVAVVLIDQNLRVLVTDIDINLDTLLIMHNSYKT